MEDRLARMMDDEEPDVGNRISYVRSRRLKIQMSDIRGWRLALSAAIGLRFEAKNNGIWQKADGEK